MDLVRPVVTFDDSQKDISFDDSGPDYNLTQASYSNQPTRFGRPDQTEF